MADVDIKCDNCGNVMTVSEFADPEMVSCGSCGEKLRQGAAPAAASVGAQPGSELSGELSGKDVEPPKEGRLSLQSSEKPKEGSPDDPNENLSKAELKAIKKEQKARRKAHSKEEKEEVEQVKNSYNLISWIIFFVLAGIMFMLRYGTLVDEKYADTVGKFTNFSQTYATYIFIVIQVTIILQAFKDSVYQGVLCFLVPMYSLYYLLAVCDIFIFRAIMLGLLVGFGQDCGVKMEEIGGAAFKIVTEWIASGG